MLLPAVLRLPSRALAARGAAVALRARPRTAPEPLARCPGLARGATSSSAPQGPEAGVGSPEPAPPGVVMGQSSIHGIGVFAARSFRAGEVLEVCPYLEVCRDSLERAEPETGVDLRDYLFDVRPQDCERRAGVMLLPLGCGMAYNHRSDSNVAYTVRPQQREIVFRARQDIRQGEELFIDYGDEWWRGRGWQPMAENFAALRARMGRSVGR
mmetsp:Transcript_71473/g.220641  ORF Transcript_71473/g.220641 Transcript_71473/m.220641 type:complete len:212 (-) Transcript_71473:30-665(-)